MELNLLPYCSQITNFHQTQQFHYIQQYVPHVLVMCCILVPEDGRTWLKHVAYIMVTKACYIHCHVLKWIQSKKKTNKSSSFASTE